MAIEPVAAGAAADVQSINGNGHIDQAGNEPDAGAEEIDQGSLDENVGGNIDVQA
jgi:hypothetical protein